MEAILKRLIIIGILLTPSTVLSQTLAAWGDSLTAGAGGTPWPTQFTVLSGVPSLNRGVGGETSTQIAARFLAEPSTWNDFTVIWAGNINFTDPTTVESDIALMVSSLTTSDYLILGLINGDYGGYESVGGEGYSYITGINSDLAASYGSRFIDIRSILVNSYDPLSAQDLSDFARDIVPSSLRSDSIHLNTAGYGIVSNAVYAAYAATPLPSTLWLFGSGLLGLFGMAKKKAA